ncbi:MAG: hypothetical protein ACJ72P_03010 [Nocardioides sp.]
MLAALMIAAMPAAFGVIRNASFMPETPVRISEQTSDPTAPQLQRPDPQVDQPISGKEDLESRLTERRQAHNEGDD